MSTSANGNRHALATILFSALTFSSAPLAWADPVPGGSLDPTTIPKYRSPLTVLPTMPKTGVLSGGIDYYEIAVRQFQQQVLPSGMPATTVWGYGSVNHPGTFQLPGADHRGQSGPAGAGEVDQRSQGSETGNFLPHLLPDRPDPALGQPAAGLHRLGTHAMTDCRGKSQAPYTGPVPIVTHLHGAHVNPDSDGYPEAWYLPDANNIPAGYATEGRTYDQIPGAPIGAGRSRSTSTATTSAPRPSGITTTAWA